MSVRKTNKAALSAQAAQMDWLNDLPAEGLSADNTLQCLHAWAELGWLRRLDSALATQLHRLDSATPPAVLVAAAVLTAGAWALCVWGLQLDWPLLPAGLG